jgi:hypothetical protein
VRQLGRSTSGPKVSATCGRRYWAINECPLCCDELDFISLELILEAAHGLQRRKPASLFRASCLDV